jgi:predicted protein tyrosine phosphatase
MDVRLFLKEDFAEAFHLQAIPHVGEHAKTYVQIAQAIAMIDQLLETPYFEQCVQTMKSIDPGNSIPIEFGFFESPIDVMLKELHETIEKEKHSVIRTFRTVLKKMPKDFMEKIKERIERFHKKKDALCLDALYQFEYMVEMNRFEKIKRSL